MEATIGIGPMNKGFADLCLTAWLRRHIQNVNIIPQRVYFVNAFSQNYFYFYLRQKLRRSLLEAQRHYQSRLPWHIINALAHCM